MGVALKSGIMKIQLLFLMSMMMFTATHSARAENNRHFECSAQTRLVFVKGPSDVVPVTWVYGFDDSDRMKNCEMMARDLNDFICRRYDSVWTSKVHCAEEEVDGLPVFDLSVKISIFGTPIGKRLAYGHRSEEVCRLYEQKIGSTLKEQFGNY
jgi:hypothetical protein